jgi:hypothetical protein
MPKKTKHIAPTFTFLGPAEHAELEHAMQVIQRKLDGSDESTVQSDFDYLDDPRLKYANSAR